MKKLLLPVLVGLAVLWITMEKPPVQAAEARCRHDVCVANCLAYQYFLAGENNFYAWYDTAYRLTDCNQSTWETAAYFLLDLAAEVFEAPGGATMQCWQMILGQSSVCSTQCNNANPKDCRYAPNVRADLATCQAGQVTVNYDNPSADMEYNATAYSRQFPARAFLQRNGGQRLMVYKADMPSINISNWIVNGGQTGCLTQYGDSRCNLLDPFLKPSEVTADINTSSGALFDLTSLINSSSGADSSPADGYIALKSDGDSVTFKQGFVSGKVYVWEHNYENNTYSESVSDWNTYNGAQTFSNSECNCWWCTCHITHDQVDRDTYVYALEGPADKALSGDYSVAVEAPSAHDKDISNNNTTCQYTVDSLPPPGNEPTYTPTPTPFSTPTPVVIGQGSYTGDLEPQEYGDLYQFYVPAGVSRLEVGLSVPPGANFDFKMKRGQMVSRDTNTFCGPCGDCYAYAGPGQNELCTRSGPPSGTYYLLVYPSVYHLGGDYTLTIHFYASTQTPTLTLTPSATPTPTRSLTASKTPTQTKTPTRTRTPTKTRTVTRTKTTTKIPTFTRTPTLPSSNVKVTGYVYQAGTQNGLAAIKIYFKVLETGQIVYAGQTGRTGFYSVVKPLPNHKTIQIYAEKSGYSFSPPYYEWSHGGAAEEKQYNFTAAFTTLTPPPPPGPSATPFVNMWGWVHEENGPGVPGVRIVLRSGSSDAFQVVATTDADGYYKNYVVLPEGLTIRVWAEKVGYVFSPAFYEWPYYGERYDRQMDFIAQARTLTPTRTRPPKPSTPSRSK
jgi:hypothetical protein